MIARITSVPFSIQRPDRLQPFGGAADAVLGAGQHGAVEVVLQFGQARQQVAQLVGRDPAQRLAGGQLGGDVAQPVEVVVLELQQRGDRRQRLAAERADPVALGLAVPDQQLVFLQALHHGFQLHRIDEGELLADLRRRPLRCVRARAQRAQHQQAQQHLCSRRRGTAR